MGIAGVAAARIAENFLTGGQEGRKEQAALAYQKQQNTIKQAMELDKNRRANPYPDEVAAHVKGIDPGSLDTILEYLGHPSTGEHSANITKTNAEAVNSGAQAGKANAEANQIRQDVPPNKAKIENENTKNKRLGSQFLVSESRKDEQAGIGDETAQKAFQGLDPATQTAMMKLNALKPDSPEFQRSLGVLEDEYKDAVTNGDVGRQAGIRGWMRLSPVFQGYQQAQAKPAGEQGGLESLMGILKGLGTNISTGYSGGSQEN